jgi:hypothetical protein
MRRIEVELQLPVTSLCLCHMRTSGTDGVQSQTADLSSVKSSSSWSGDFRNDESNAATVWPESQPGPWHIGGMLLTNPLLLGEKLGFRKKEIVTQRI